MKRWTILALVALIGGALHAETLLDAIDQSNSTHDIKKIKAQVEVLEADVNATFKDDSYAGTQDGYTPLTYSINTLSDKTRQEAVKYLLDHKANPNAKCSKRDGLEWTPLSEALLKEDIVVVKMLLDGGADPSLPIRCSNYISGGTTKTRFGDAYDRNLKLKANALDIAVSLRAPALIELIKAKSPKLVPTYNTNTIWYEAYTNDLAGFKAAIKAGAMPDDYDMAYLIHYGKLDCLSFIDAASVYTDTSNGFNLVDDSPDVATISAYFDKNMALLVSDPEAFKAGMLALSVNWEKIKKNPGILAYQWRIHSIVARFAMNYDLEERMAQVFKTLDVKPAHFER